MRTRVNLLKRTRCQNRHSHIMPRTTMGVRIERLNVKTNTHKPVIWCLLVVGSRAYQPRFSDVVVADHDALDRFLIRVLVRFQHRFGFRSLSNKFPFQQPLRSSARGWCLVEFLLLGHTAWNSRDFYWYFRICSFIFVRNAKAVHWEIGFIDKIQPGHVRWKQLGIYYSRKSTKILKWTYKLKRTTDHSPCITTP